MHYEVFRQVTYWVKNAEIHFVSCKNPKLLERSLSDRNSHVDFDQQTAHNYRIQSKVHMTQPLFEHLLNPPVQNAGPSLQSQSFRPQS